MATIQNPQVNLGRRRFLNLDLLVKITVPLLLVFLLIIALEMESFGWYARLFRELILVIAGIVCVSLLVAVT